MNHSPSPAFPGPARDRAVFGITGLLSVRRRTLRNGRRVVRTLRAFYFLYERWLLREIRKRPAPRHVGIILDGNRRHGRAHGITAPRELYGLGAQKLDEVLDWCAELAHPRRDPLGVLDREISAAVKTRSPASSARSRPSSRRWRSPDDP